MKIKRVFTQEGKSPYHGLTFEKRTSEIREIDGKKRSAADITVPSFWSQVAADIIAQKYCRRTGVPQLNESGVAILDEHGRPLLGAETDSRQVFNRLAMCWRQWGERYDYFDSAKDAQIF